MSRRRDERPPGPMRYRDDIDPAKTYLWSDTHFGHENIVKFCHRPLDHDQLMLAEARAIVPDDATLLHLGDLCYKGNAYFQNIVAPEIPGADKKIVLGNHDRNRPSFYKSCGFQVCRPFKLRIAAGPEGVYVLDPEADREDYTWDVSFSHYPWNEDEDGEMPPWNLRIHGHIHNNGYTRNGYVPFLLNHVNISVEQTKYKPVNLKVLLDAVLLGKFSETTDAQLAEARRRKEANQS